MARITVEDCLKKIPNRFQLTLAATYRARQLTAGGTPQIELDAADRDKPTVIALREVAATGTLLTDLRSVLPGAAEQRAFLPLRFPVAAAPAGALLVFALLAAAIQRGGGLRS